jgi:hypothetical protein
MNPFKQDTDCYSCIGCQRCEDLSFKGIKNCKMYRPGYPDNSFIDDICKRYTQERMGGAEYAKTKD